ncbi:MAG: terminase small subunit [Mucilaginibacter sp.]
MAAPANNKFWMKRSKHGRDKIFASPEILLNACYEYFEYQSNQAWYKQEAIKGGDNAGLLIPVPTSSPFSIEGLCIFLGVHSKYLNEFENNLKPKEKEIDKDFSNIITHVREVIYTQKAEGATVGAYNASIIARQLGLSDKQEITGKDGEAIKSELVVKIIDSGPLPVSSEKDIDLK